MGDWVMIGVPTSAGAHHAGQDRAPDALRAAGLAKRLAAAGETVQDAGNLPGSTFAVDHDHPDARNLAAVARVAREVADAVAAVDGGRLPLVVGGDCTITLGVIAGFRRRHPDVGLVYVDGDADVGVPGDGGSGILDSMGVSHLLGRGAPELTGLAGPVPLLNGAGLAIVGADPRETDDDGRRYLAGNGVSLQEAPSFLADPAGAAARAIEAVAAAGGPVVVHVDVDVIDSGDLPLGNFPHYGSGPQLEDVVACLRVLRAHPSFGGLVLTEVNPTHDADGSLLGRYVDGVVRALAAGPEGGQA
jgi:arginase